MDAVGSLLWGLLAGVAVTCLADALIAASQTPESLIRSCLGGQTHLKAELRCWPLTWRYGWRQAWSQCRQGSGWRRPRPWLTVGLLLAYAHWLRQMSPAWGFGPLLVAGAYFVLVAIVDAETHLVPYEEALLGLGIALVVGVPRHGWGNTLAGIMGGALVMGLFYWLGERYAYWQARRSGQGEPDEPALGFGDVYLSGVLGGFLGWPGVFGALILGSLLMGVFVLALGMATLIRQRNLKGLGGRYLPMAPFLVLAALWLMLNAP